MRNFIISVVLCALPTMTFAECDDPLLKKIASSVHPKQEVYHGAYNTDPMSCKKIPNNPEQTIFAEILEKEKVENEDNDSGAYDLSLVIAKNNGEIIGRYHKNDFYNTGNGGTVLDDIKVDTANYRLNADTRAFGIVSNFSGRDGREEEITLYVLKQNKIVPVLSNLTLVSSPTVGFDLKEQSEFCNSNTDSDVKRTIVMTQNVTNGFNDILINEKRVQYKYRVTKKSCDVQKEDKTTKKYTLKYDDKKGAYDAPEEIAIPDLD